MSPAMSRGGASGAFTGDSGSRTPPSSSVAETPSASARGSSSATSGRLAPSSHLLTALSVTFSMAASSFWVRSRSFRSWRISGPIFAFSIVVLPRKSDVTV